MNKTRNKKNKCALNIKKSLALNFLLGIFQIRMILRIKTKNTRVI